MEETSAQHTKISDSAYSNSCSNSQSQRSTGSSKSRHSNSSESSGYCGGRPVIHAPCTAALPQPISKRKDQEHKKKKTGPAMVVPAETELPAQNDAEAPHDADVCPDVRPQIDSQKTVEVAVVELVDATDPEEHNSTGDGSLDSSTASCVIDDTVTQANEGFCALISMQDGVVLYTTPSLSLALGFPSESWIGRSFVDFVHPKDRKIFIGQITNGLTTSYADNPKEPGVNGQRASLFCRLRIYTGANCGKMEKPVRYLPFLVTLTYRDFREHSSVEHLKTLFLVATVQPVISAYKAPEETIISSRFTTRHTATCHFSYCDPEVGKYFGYLPQDMIGRSLFEFYHPEDLPFIKDIYETVVKLRGTSFRSKPYRFAVQNGGYLVLETEWSSFVNPWSRKLEFVIGHHRVLKGPSNPDVFQPLNDAKRNTLADISEEVLKESKIIQGEIRSLLNEIIPRPEQVFDRFKDLAPFMETLLTETKMSELKIDVPAEEKSISEHDSVMLGEISPHHEYFDNKSSTETPPSYNHLNYNGNIDRYFNSNPITTTMYGSEEGNVNLPSSAEDEYADSKSSSETPLSYNQLNYNENIHRYFNSNPLITTIYGSEEGNVSVASSADDEDFRHKSKRQTSTDAAGKCMSPVNGGGATGSGSSGNLSNGSNNHGGSASKGDTSNAASNTTETASFKLPTLTESVLTKHNEDTEKLMVQRHREMRSTIKNNDKLKDLMPKKLNDPPACTTGCQNRKRSCIPARQQDNAKKSRHDDVTRTHTVEQDTPNTDVETSHASGMPQGNAGVSFWSPYSIGAPAIQQPDASSTQCVSARVKEAYPGVAHMIPIYYVPAQQNTTKPINSNMPGEHPRPTHEKHTTAPNSYVQWVTSGIAGVMYPTVLVAQQPIAMMYQPFIRPELISPMQNARGGDTSQNLGNKSENTSALNRPPSQATSIKAEPGSIMAMSECSKKHCQAFSSCQYRHGSNLLNVHLLAPHLGTCSHCGISKNLSECLKNVKVLSPGELCSPRVSADEDCLSENREPTKKKTKLERLPQCTEDDSSYSSFYSSFLNKSSDSSCNSDQKGARDRLKKEACEQAGLLNNDKQRNQRRKDPPWLEGVILTHDLIYKYQMSPKVLEEVLQADKIAMKNMTQPLMVNDQLNQLYLDLAVEGFDTKLMMDERLSYGGSDQSVSSSYEDTDTNLKYETKQCPSTDYGQLLMIHEDNAPFPPPQNLVPLSNVS